MGAYLLFLQTLLQNAEATWANKITAVAPRRSKAVAQGRLLGEIVLSISNKYCCSVREQKLSVLKTEPGKRRKTRVI